MTESKRNVEAVDEVDAGEGGGRAPIDRTDESSTRALNHQWTIIVADQAGDTVDITANEHEHLSQLLREGLQRLEGAHANPDDYDLLIDGTVQENLTLTLDDANLHNHAEVVIVPKDVSRG